jgi:Rieske Fe-S protein
MFAVGLTSATGLSVSGCGDDSTTAGGAAPATDLGAAPSATPLRTTRAGITQPTSKSDVYQRGPEQRPAKTAAPEPTPELAATGQPTVGSRGGDNLATARQGEGKSTGRPTAPATPAPLPPGAFARTSEIPVGGGKTFKEQKIVVTQPTAGQYKGFDATCTHTGCLVDKVEAGQIICPCHGSRFSIADGKVEKGPALLALPAKPVSVAADGSISQG